MKKQGTDAGNGSSLTPAIFLDRDGVINRKLPENQYVRRVDEFRFLPGVLQALPMLRDLGFLLIVVTNQRGIARRFMTEKDLEEVHRHMRQAAEVQGAALDGVYHCPHENYENCRCRKPEPGMLLEAAHQLGVDLSRSFMVGDSRSDVEAGKRAGTMTVLISDGEKGEADMIFPSLLDFALFLGKIREQAFTKKEIKL